VLEPDGKISFVPWEPPGVLPRRDHELHAG
jgi:hypothetical protein